jgi:hypothetical protein
VTSDIAKRLEPHPPEARGLSAGAFRDLLRAFQAIRVPLALDAAREAAESRRQELETLIATQITDARWRELLQRAREAAERGAHESLLLRFPSDACADRGRAIIEQETGWPKTLTGEAEVVYRHWQDELRPKGFQLAARVVEFVGGIPGDMGLFLTWQA